MPDVRTAPAVTLVARSPRRWRTALPLLVCVVYAVLQLAAGPQWTLFPDSYRYARAAERYLGASREEAHRTALAAFCASRASREAHEARLQPTNHRGEQALEAAADLKCRERWADAADITTADPRYQAIFSARPGYPLLVAPFVAAFGVLDGMWLLGLLTAAGGSLLVFGLLRRGAGLGRTAGLTGQVVFLASPLGWWSAQALSEGLFTMCTLGALWGGLVLLRRRSLPTAAACTALAYGVGAVTRYSSVLVLAAFVAVAATGALVVPGRLRHRGTAVLAGVSAVAAAAVAVAMKALALPSAQVTLQDTFTHHFRLPETADPWGQLLSLAGRFWRDWAAQQAGLPYFPALTALAVWALWRYGEGLGLLAAATALTGAFVVSNHPLVQEADRLGVLMWMPVVLGLPLAVDRHWAWRRARDPEPSPPHEPEPSPAG
ncbi:hypothetical protein ACQEWB_16745 [Streptomyces sp. CA-249302]|uniref:hypothetical protein n=1 Tax=Streptomyces sp. CA-249302 TaxID=3240058 RepID=UPI003D8F8691